MRTKLLLFPFLLLIIIGAIVWRIIPDWNTVQQKKVDLTERQEQLREVREKNAKIDELIKVYNNESGNVKLINEYIPSQAGDEEIINNLIYYANAQGGDRAISVSDISIGKKSASENSSMSMPSQISGIDAGDIEKILGERMDIGERPSDPIYFDVKVSFKSKYEGMKDFFTKIGSLKRSNKIKSFDVGSNDNGNELKVMANIEFNYLKKYDPIIVDGSYLKNDLDKGVIEKVKNNTTVDISKVEIGAVGGRVNPFLP